MGITSGQIIKLLKKNLILILVCAVVFAGAFFGYTKVFIANTYQSAVKFCVSTTLQGGTASDVVTQLAYEQRLVSTTIEILDTNSFYAKVADKLSQRYSAAQLANIVVFSTLNDTEVFQAQVSAKSQTDTKLIADTIAEIAPTVITEYKKNVQLKVVDPALVPQTPVAPNPVINTALGFLLGLILSVAYVLIRNYFDIRIKSTDEELTALNIPVLAYIPNFESMFKQHSTVQ